MSLPSLLDKEIEGESSPVSPDEHDEKCEATEKLLLGTPFHPSVLPSTFELLGKEACPVPVVLGSAERFIPILSDCTLRNSGRDPMKCTSLVCASVADLLRVLNCPVASVGLVLSGGDVIVELTPCSLLSLYRYGRC